MKRRGNGGGLAAPALFIAVAAGCAAVPRGPDETGARVYAPNQAAASVSVIDATSFRVVETIDLRSLGFGPDARPHHTAVEPDGSHWYVSLIGEQTILKFDRGNRLVGRVRVPAAGMIAIDPVADRLLVSPSMTAVNPPSALGVVTRTAMRADLIEVLIPRPHALVIHPRGRWAYVGSVAQNQFVVLDLETERTTPVTVEGEAPNTFVQFAISPDGSRLVVTGQYSGDLLAYDTSDPAAPRFLARVAVGRGPYHPAFAPDGRTVYVAAQREDAIVFVDARDWRVVRRVNHESLAQPHGIAPSRDGRWLFVSNENVGAPAPAGEHAEHAGMRHDAPAASPDGRVVVIAARSGTVAHIIPTGRQTAGLSFSSAPR
jgi:DNA-binding beta-propeller fold protein YncE